MEVESAGACQGWLDASGILVALSGGGDSMALLSLLRGSSFRGNIAAAHLEHGFRGESSLADAEFVREYCAREDIPCFISHVDVTSLRMRGESAEMAGRRIRYEFFEDVCRREGIPFIATAHNAGDVVETMTYNFFRGTGAAGLVGISARRNNIVRPVIRCSRESLRDFLREKGIPWREDETNAENDYTRNRIRNQLLPWVRSNINESADRSLLGLAREAAATTSSSREEAGGYLSLVSRYDPCALAAWDTPTAGRIPDEALRHVIREQGRELGLPVLDRRRMENLCGLIKKGGRWRFQWASDVEICGDSLLMGWLRRDSLTPPPDGELSLALGESAKFEWGSWTAELCVKRSNEVARRGRSVWGASLYTASSLCRVFISCADNFMRKNNLTFRVKIPWWKALCTPIISLKDESALKTWMPGVRKSVHNEGDYVIIAKVFAPARQSRKEEKHEFR
ncbi:MAG: tRNA lysidine(34) synthetase TilS [Synergistaceae bacterium]|jgi:tRNA(Ile)-lysidine synthase|nr:tRNA lysidine(34) synthetase TilS [Synergistaceae bacterium]